PFLELLEDRLTPNSSPVLGGITTANQNINDTATVTPFSTVTISDPDPDTEMVTITYTADNGVFTPASLTASGFTGSAGNYTFSGTASAAQDATRQLEFDPTDNQVAHGQTVTTTFTVDVNDGDLSASDSQTTVVATSVNDAPVLGGITTASQDIDDT